MPIHKIPCPTCDGLMAPKSAQCRKCKPSYERTEAHKKSMGDALRGKPKPHLRGRKRPAHSRMMKDWWTEERREEARRRGLAFADDPEWRRKIAESVTGESNPRWEGGLSATPYAPGFSRKLKAQVRERDDHRCQLCGATEDELGYALTVHHSDYDKTNHDPENLHSTCKGCNSRVNSNRDVWYGYFLALAQMRRKLGKNIGKLIGRKVITQREGFIQIRDVSGGDVGPDISGLLA